MWQGLRQPDQHVQTSCGRKENAGRKAWMACAQRGRWVGGEARQRLGQALLKILNFSLRSWGSW